MNSLPFNIHGIKVIVETDVENFYNFVDSNYLTFKVDSMFLHPEVHTIFSKDAGKFAKMQKKHLTRISEGFYIGETSIYWENEFGFSIFLDFSTKNSWKVFSFHFDLLKNIDSEDKYKNYMRSMRWSIHFPVFILLDHLKGIKLVHASAVAKKGISTLFCGLNKVGKSSLALYFYKNLDYKVVSDNFLLIGNGNVYSFPEMCRLSPEVSRNLKIPINNKQLIYGKYHLKIPCLDIMSKSRPKFVYIVTNSDEVNIVEVERTKALRLLTGMHDYLQEFPKYTFYGVFDYFGFGPKAESDIDMFPENARFFILSHKMNWDYKSIVEGIAKNEI
jgi:hypothetical protein